MEHGNSTVCTLVKLVILKNAAGIWDRSIEEIRKLLGAAFDHQSDQGISMEVSRACSECTVDADD